MTLSETLQLGVNSLAKSGVFGPPLRIAHLSKDYENSAMDAAVRLIHQESWKVLRQMAEDCGQPTPKREFISIHRHGNILRMRIRRCLKKSH